ncbi:serine/threonine protein kinase [Sclerotinia borealis F-4128]|uniref:Serine/threonine protein kinase n=1 Tax=Sclerotinia borealis (strain F-4128) TaxID=1432307 RepID=W9CM16_SCLBF|nr:serine/threonine protein kinase [Sclerotinia borealis F-4128]
MAAAIIKSAIDAISSADLSPTEHLLLKHFVEEATHPEVAAKYIQLIISQDKNDVESRLRQFKVDWRKLASRLMAFDPISERLDALVRDEDGPYCTVTMFRESDTRPAPKPVESSHVIPPSFLQNIESAEEGRLLIILEAFLSTSQVDRLRTLLSGRIRNDAIFLQNLWLLSPSMHKAFRTGHIEVRKRIDEPDVVDTEALQVEMYYALAMKHPETPRNLFFGNGVYFSGFRAWFSISTTNPRNLPLPSDFLFDIHRRFTTALHLFSIEDKINRGWPKPSILQQLFRLPISIFKRDFHRLWLWAPVSTRLYCYRHMIAIGKRIYGPEDVHWVQRVPFGLYIKKTNGTSWNESNALNMVERYTSIPAPRSVDVIEDSKTRTTLLVMTRVHGQRLKESINLMSYAERDQLVDDLAKYVSQLRKNPNTTPYLFADTLSGPMYDHLIPNRIGGPFHTELDLNIYKFSEVGGNDVTLAEIYDGEENIPQGHRSFFTHSDLHFSNIMVDQGRLCGLIDWECDGFKPEYWEFTHAIFGVWGRKDLMTMFQRIFGNQYDKVLKTEERLWRLSPVF